MIWVTRLNGSEIVVNADLIETVESTGDTVVTLVDNKKFVVHETPAEIVSRIQSWRASVLRRVEAAPSADDEVALPPSEHPNADLYVLRTGRED